jgi:hypothetical protein
MKAAPRTQEALIKEIRKAADRVTGVMIRNWFKNSGFDVGLPTGVPVGPNKGQDRCTLPSDATFLRREHVLCVDEAGRTRREKKVRNKTWSRYDKDADIDRLAFLRQSLQLNGLTRFLSMADGC